MALWFSVGIQKLLKSDLAEPGKTETRLRLQTEHRKNLREFEKKIVTELDEKVMTDMIFLLFFFFLILFSQNQQYHC